MSRAGVVWKGLTQDDKKKYDKMHDDDVKR